MNIELLAAHGIFANCTAEETHDLSKLFYKASLTPGQKLFDEGETASHFYIIASGEIELKHRDPNNHHYFSFEKVPSTHSIGDDALIEGEIYHMAAFATQETNVYVANGKELMDYIKNHPLLYKKLLANVSSTLVKKLKSTRKMTVTALKEKLEEYKIRTNLGRFIVYILFLITFHNLFIEVLQDLAKVQGTSSTYNTITLLSIVAVVLLVMIKHMGYPLSEFGFNLHDWRNGLKEALRWTLALVISVTLGKLILVIFVSELHTIPLFDFSAALRIKAASQHTFLSWLIPMMLYTAFVPVQTFIISGAFQSSLMRFLTGPHAITISVLLTGLLFASLHVTLSGYFAFATLVPGLLWAWLYTKQRSLLGITVSHIILGIWTIWILGFDRLIGLAPY